MEPVRFELHTTLQRNSIEIPASLTPPLLHRYTAVHRLHRLGVEWNILTPPSRCKRCVCTTQRLHQKMQTLQKMHGPTAQRQQRENRTKQNETGTIREDYFLWARVPFSAKTSVRGLNRNLRHIGKTRTSATPGTAYVWLLMFAVFCR